MSHIYNHIYAKNSLKNWVLKCWIERLMWTCIPFLYEHQNTFPFHQNKHLWCSCKVWIEAATTDWSQHPHMSSKHNGSMTHFPLWHIFTRSNYLQITRLVCLCVNIHCWLDVYSYFDCGWMKLGEINVGNKSSINHKWVAWEVRG